jgi:uncharacterized RDD family membrane protein YckC
VDRLKLLLRRLAGLLYDAMLAVALMFLATALILPLNGGQAFQTGHWGYAAYLAVVTFLFVGWFWTHGGQTLGMKAWHLKLQGADGGPVGWGAAAVRFAAALVSLGVFGAGYAWILVDPQGVAWHGRLSRTRMRLESRSR